MIINNDHPDAARINVYGMSGRKLSHIISVDTDKMQAKKFISFDVTGIPVIIVVPVLKIKGPGIYFSRKLSRGRIVNAGKT